MNQILAASSSPIKYISEEEWGNITYIRLSGPAESNKDIHVSPQSCLRGSTSLHSIQNRKILIKCQEHLLCKSITNVTSYVSSSRSTWSSQLLSFTTRSTFSLNFFHIFIHLKIVTSWCLVSLNIDVKIWQRSIYSSLVHFTCGFCHLYMFKVWIFPIYGLTFLIYFLSLGLVSFTLLILDLVRVVLSFISPVVIHYWCPDVHFSIVLRFFYWVVFGLLSFYFDGYFCSYGIFQILRIL